MKVYVAVCLLVLSSICFAQTKAEKPKTEATPAFSDKEKLDVRDAQRGVEKIEKQISDIGKQSSDLTVQFLTMQENARGQVQQLTQQLKDAQAKLADLQKQLTGPVDEKKWTPDWEALEYKAVPPPEDKKDEKK